MRIRYNSKKYCKNQLKRKFKVVNIIDSLINNLSFKVISTNLRAPDDPASKQGRHT